MTGVSAGPTEGEPEQRGVEQGPAGHLPPMDLVGRVGRVRARLGEAGCDALLVSNRSNVRYLTGFSGSAGMLLVGAADAVLVTDGRYGAQAARELAASGAEVEVAALWANEQLTLLGQLVKDVARVGVEAENVSWAAQRAWSEGWAKGVELVPTSRVVERLREFKDKGEIARIAAAAAVADEALAMVMGMLPAQPREVELAVALDAEMRRLGADGPSFETIVASGPTGPSPITAPPAASWAWATWSWLTSAPE